jgi:K+ transporter
MESIFGVLSVLVWILYWIIMGKYDKKQKNAKR